MKQKKLVCNLKSSLSAQEFQFLLSSLKYYDEDVEILLAPSYPYISMIPEPFKRVSQDVSIYNDLYAVGEVTAKTLKSIDTEYVIVGHGDRQLRFNESEVLYIKKINNALSENMKVIYCIGETREQKSRQKTLMILEKKIARVFNKIEGNLQNIIIAYEPIWAISNNKNSFEYINVSEVSENINFIKKLVKDYYDVEISVLYGGSVNDKNIDLYRNLKSDGLLIGHASLNADSIKKIVSKM